MFAWRGRLGLIAPTRRGKVFHYWYRLAPDGVEIVPAAIGFRRGERAQFTAGLDRAVELALELRDLGCDAVVVSGTPPFLLGGLDFERRWGQDLARRTGVPVITAMEPGAIALQTIRARRVAVATYYGDELNQAIATYFDRFGIEAASSVASASTAQARSCTRRRCARSMTCRPRRCTATAATASGAWGRRSTRSTSTAPAGTTCPRWTCWSAT